CTISTQGRGNTLRPPRYEVKPHDRSVVLSMCQDPYLRVQESWSYNDTYNKMLGRLFFLSFLLTPPLSTFFPLQLRVTYINKTKNNNAKRASANRCFNKSLFHSARRSRRVMPPFARQIKQHQCSESVKLSIHVRVPIH